MIEKLSKVIKIALKTGARIFTLTVPVVFINLIFSISLFYINRSVFIEGWQKKEQYLILLSLFLSLIFFPVLTFLIAKTYSVRKALKEILSAHQDEFWQYILIKIFEKIKSLESVHSGGMSVAAGVESFFNKMENLPFAFRFILKYISGKVPLKEELKLISKNLELKEENISEISIELTKRIGKKLEEMVEPSSVPYFISLGLNFILMISSVNL